MTKVKFLLGVLACSCLTGCFVSTKTPFITPDLAVFPIELTAGTPTELAHCSRDDTDLSDWSDCKTLTVTRAEDHYLITDADGEDDPYQIRFADAHKTDFILQVTNPDTEDDEHVYGFARIGNGKLFIALADAQFIRESTCLEIGAEYPSEEKSCLAAIDSYFELQTVMDDVAEAADYTLFITLPEA